MGSNMANKWERITTKYNDGTFSVEGYKKGEYMIRPQYIFGGDRPIGYNIFKDGKRITGRDTLKEAKAFVDSKMN